MKPLQSAKIASLLYVALLPVVLQAQFSYTTNNDGTLNVSAYTGSGGAVIVPGTNGDLLVTSIGNSAFFGCTSLTSVTIPDSVTSIDDEAFFYCSSLVAVYFQGNAPNLGSQVFGSPAFPSGLNFPVCYYLPGTMGWSSIFGGCSVFLLVPPFACTPTNGTITIASYMGGGGAVTIPTTIDYMPVTVIGSSAFRSSIITGITIPDTITTIGEDAFSGCDLTTISFPNSVTSIGNDAFEGCGSLTNITFPNNGAISIGNWSFLGCSGLTSLTIANGVNSIGYYTFGQCMGLTNVTMCGSVSSMGQFAFLGCSNLTSVYFSGNAPGADWTVFMDDKEVTVYYLPGTAGWSSTFGGSPTAEWWLPSPLILNNSSSFGVQSNGFGFIISWATNTSVVIEGSVNLANPQWCALATNTLIGGWCYFNDPHWANYPTRFYRIRSP